MISIIQKGLHYTEAEICVGIDGSEQRLTESLSLIDAVMPEIVASRQSQNQQKQTVVKNDTQETNGEEGAATVTPAVTSTEPMELDSSIEIPAEKSTILKGHESEVFICAWNPTTDLLASGYFFILSFLNYLFMLNKLHYFNIKLENTFPVFRFFKNSYYLKPFFSFVTYRTFKTN